MNNFVFCNPTKLVFGKGQIKELGNLISKDKKLMLTFGGGSVKQNGVYNQVITALKDHNFIEFWGIEPNPIIDTLKKAIAIGKENNIDFILSVGGGSCLDGTKLIAAGIVYDSDAWELVLRGYATDSIDFASVMTLPATGSEMNEGAVISNTVTKEKYAFFNRYPVFSILDPETTFSLPDYQIACGVADTFVHVVEQYMTTPNQSRIMDRWAEGILHTLIEIAPKIKQNKMNYDVMADFMLSATMALNNFIRMGITEDWATHMIGHEITALHGITHGETLTLVLCGLYKTMKEQKKEKLLQYAERIWNINIGSDDERIELALNKTEAFFKSLGLATRLSEKNISDDTIMEIANRFTTRGTKLGENCNITGEIVKQVLENCK
jgi:NADP-dependent alcohol dehydrogenase